MKSKFCLIGSPVGHSLSPAIHNYLYKKYAIDAEYSVREVTAATLPSFLNSLADCGINGFNITMPLKGEILPFLSEVSGEAVSSVNTVCVCKNGLSGYSTDARGFYRSISERGYDYSGKNVVFIGCGAAAHTLINDARKKKAAKVTVLNRSLKDGVNDTISNISLYMPNCDLLINTTPLGMKGINENFNNLDFLELLPTKSLVCDLIYNPVKTSLLAAAQRTGHPILNGLPMLIWQAFYAFNIFLGIMPDNHDFAAVYKMLS